MDKIALQTGSFSPLTLFLEADIVVKAVMVGLLLASIWTWTIIVAHWLKMRRTMAAAQNFENEFWKAEDLDGFFRKRGKEAHPSARLFTAAIKEWRSSTRGAQVDRDAARERIALAMAGSVAEDMDALADRLNFLATVGSVAPFVGLFGTVWGIMRSFTAIAAEQNSSLAVVAPGIAEALFATAIGLFSAIPAVIAYNRFSHRLNLYEARTSRFSDRLLATLGRELETLGR